MSSSVILAGLGLAAVGYGGRYPARTSSTTSTSSSTSSTSSTSPGATP